MIFIQLFAAITMIILGLSFYHKFQAKKRMNKIGNADLFNSVMSLEFFIPTNKRTLNKIVDSEMIGSLKKANLFLRLFYIMAILTFLFMVIYILSGNAFNKN